ncbi:MAG: phytanoyl-CoA dioxygenase family protein [Actinomycetota bacterium]
MFSADQRREFETVGYVRIPHAVDRDVVATMHAHAWELLEAKGYRRDDPATWSLPWSPHVGAGMVSKLQNMTSAGQGPESSPAVRAALDAIFDGTPRSEPAGWGQALVTLPVDAAEWLVPRQIWHFDHLYTQPGEIRGVNVFLLMDDIEPRGGGTAVVRNSPQLMDRILAEGATFTKLSQQNRRFLAADEWTRGLKVGADEWCAERNAAYLGDTVAHGVNVRVEELHGAAGDVFVCHPALAHAPSMNVSDRPRFMRAQRFFARGG